MRVAFTSDTYWPRVNGVAVSTNIFMNELAKLGHQVHLWAPHYPHTEVSREPEDKRVSRLPSIAVVFSQEDRLVAPFQKRRFFRELDAFDPEILHVQTEFKLSWLTVPYARKRRLPVVQSCHTYFEHYINAYLPFIPHKFAEILARRLTYHWFRHADALITPTEPMKAVLRGYGITSPITVVPTGIPEEDFQGVDRAEERRSSAWLERHPQLRGRKLMLYVGRVGREKNVDFLLDVVPLVRAQVPDAVLVVAGSGPYLDTFKAHIETRGLGDAVLCLGYIKRDELKHLYSLADVFTFASVTETQGLVTIEAMLCGTPAVAIGKMGTREVMAGDNGGYMVEDDPEAFATAVVRLLSDDALCLAKSAEASAYAQNWTAGRMAKRIEAVYEQVLRNHNAR